MPRPPRSPSVEARRSAVRRSSRDRERERHRSRSRVRGRRDTSPNHLPRPNVQHNHPPPAPPRNNYPPSTRDSSKEGVLRRRSRVRSPLASPPRAPRSNVYRSDRPATSRHREETVSSLKRRRERSPSPSRDRKHRRQASVNAKRSLSPARRDERERPPRAPTPDTYIPRRRRSRSRDSHRPSHHDRTPSRERAPAKFSGGHTTSHQKDSRKSRDREHRGRDFAESDLIKGHRRGVSPESGSKYRKDYSARSPDRRHSPSHRANRRPRSPDYRGPRSPADKHSTFVSRDLVRVDSRRTNTDKRSSRRPHSPPYTSASKISRDNDYDRRRNYKEDSHRRRSSKSPSGDRRGATSASRDDRKRERSRSRDRHLHRGDRKSHRGRSRSRTPPTPDHKMSWRGGAYDHRGPQPARGGWPQQDPRYSHSPPFQQGFQGSPQGQPGFSPQQSPYPPQNGQPDRGYFNQQQSPTFGQPPAHSPYSHGSPTGPPPAGGMFPPSRGGYRGTQASYNQRTPQPPPAQTAGPHVRNLSWTPKTGTRGGHAPVTHGAALQANSESTTPSQEQPSLFNGTENPFRPASKDLRVDDEAGKSSKAPSNEQSPVVKAAPEVAKEQHSPQIRFGLPKTGATPAVAKTNPFEKKKNPFDTSGSGNTPASAASPSRSNDRFKSSSQYDSRTPRDNDSRREDSPPRPKGPKSSLKRPDQGRFNHRRKGAPPVHWNPLPPNFGGKSLRKTLQSLRAAVVTRGHPLKEIQWPALRQALEPIEEDDPPGLEEAIANMAILEEDAYRENPKKRPKGKPPLLKDGETLEKIFTTEVVTTKHKVRRPEKVLPLEYRNSNVYYRKPGNESVVGFGTYGKVFKAKHIYKGKDVALKRLRMEAEKDGFPITAMREMKILKHLEQREADGVIRLLEVLYEVNLAGSVGCFMAFEYMPHDLTGLLNHPTFSLSDAQKKDLSYQMIDAIGFMHKQGVLHRDIKAANILVSHKGQIKLADFGLARFYDMDKQLNYTNRVVTIWYRAPELLYGATEYGPPIDVWAAACVIVEIFTKHAIFPGSGRELNQLVKLWEVLGFPTQEQWPSISKTEWYFLMRPPAHTTYPSTFATKYQPRLSAELFDLLTSMFLYDPDKRPTAEQCLSHPFFTDEGPKMLRVELDTLGDWHELESKRARKAKEGEERAKKVVEEDLAFGPPSCGQKVVAGRRDREYNRSRLDAVGVGVGKRGQEFSPIEPEAKKVKA